jgi:cobalt-precorrin-5B (C1)-methyltransferase
MIYYLWQGFLHWTGGTPVLRQAMLSPMDAPQGKLRSGYTTGACATAATRAALLALIYQRSFGEVSIRLPQGESVAFALYASAFSETEGRASVIKDAGDDPDVTDKAEIRACVRWSGESGITFQGGSGVGRVTKPGLPVPPGEPAINPVPREMMRDTIMEVLAEAGARHDGVVVEISVPRGAELARKTFNPRLGITGGISILGTSGIVVPYSTSAWVASVVQAIDVAAAQGCQHLALTVGGRSERAAQALFALPEVAFVQMGPFFGAALRQCAQVGIERVSLVGMIGKLAKFAGGHESVHSTASSQDFALLARLAAAAGADPALGAHIHTANTAQEVAELVGRSWPNFFTLLCQEAWNVGRSLVGNGLLEIVLTGIEGQVLGRYPPS